MFSRRRGEREAGFDDAGVTGAYRGVAARKPKRYYGNSGRKKFKRHTPKELQSPEVPKDHEPISVNHETPLDILIPTGLVQDPLPVIARCVAPAERSLALGLKVIIPRVFGEFARRRWSSGAKNLSLHGGAQLG